MLGGGHSGVTVQTIGEQGHTLMLAESIHPEL